jgi:nucleotide-binding universal stress UspA family protein
VFSNVLVALKESVPHEPLIELARKAATDRAQLHLVTLVRVGLERDELERLHQVEAGLTGAADVLRDAGYDATWEANLLAVSAAVDLIDIAERRAADLLVVGLAKRTRVGKALMGSDAQRVLLSASCPVLVRQLHGL